MNRLQEACQKNGPLCVGLDTDPSYIPDEVLANYETPAAAVLAYNRAIIERLGTSAACCKIQIAYYEAMGIEGLKTYVKTIEAVKKIGFPVISDIKRGDIADTANAYARAHFSGDFETDIVTVNPYMGFETLEPFANYAEKGKGFFVLLRTSNPGMTDIEGKPLAGSATGDHSAGMYTTRVLDLTGNALLNLEERFRSQFPQKMWNGKTGCSPAGAVVGCTEESDARAIRNRYPGIFFLIPGYGAQGGAARIAATLLDHAGGTVNSSRGILCAWKKSNRLAVRRDSHKLTLSDIAETAAEAAAVAKADLLGAKRLLEKN